MEASDLVVYLIIGFAILVIVGFSVWRAKQNASVPSKSNQSGRTLFR